MDKKESQSEDEKGFLKIVCIISVVIFCIVLLLVIFFRSGKTTTTGDYEGLTTTNRVSCVSNAVTYPFFEYDNANGKEAKIDITFRDEKINTISLIYKLYYSDEEKINLSESFNHAAMNLSFSDNSLGPDAFSATYSKLPDNLQFSIYASDDEITNSALKYFMLDSINRNDYNDEFIANYYSNMGMNCQITK